MVQDHCERELPGPAFRDLHLNLNRHTRPFDVGAVEHQIHPVDHMAFSSQALTFSALSSAHSTRISSCTQATGTAPGLAARGRPSDESILGWVSKHGLLTLKDKGKHPAAGSGEELNQASISLDEFVAEVLRARSAVNLYTTLNEGSAQDLKKWVRNISEDYRRMKPLSEMDHLFYKRWRDIPDEANWTDGITLQFWAIIILEGFVMRRLAEVRPAFWGEILPETPPNAYKPVQSWNCPDLLSAIYLQLYLWMTGSLPMRRCINPPCGTPFPLTRKDKYVCNRSCGSNLRHYPHLQQRRKRRAD